VSPRVREDSVHPRLQSGASARPLNFTVRGQREARCGVLRRGLCRLPVRLLGRTESRFLLRRLARHADLVDASFFPHLLQSINTWHALTAILATFIVSVPIGLVIARLVGRHAIMIALSSALTVFVVASLPWFIVSWPGPWRFPKLLDGIALCTIVVAPALMVSLTRMLPSNNRWRGP
jgi:hypothetical protein